MCLYPYMFSNQRKAAIVYNVHMSENSRLLEKYESLGPQVFGESAIKVEPEKIPALIEAYVKRAIDTAPKVDEHKPLEHDIYHWLGSGDGVMLFKIPDDLHLLPLIERELFKQLSELGGNEANLSVDPKLLATLDPEMPDILKKYYPEEDNRVETPFDHELRHFFELDEERQGKVIAFGLGRRIDGDIEELFFSGAFMHYQEAPLSYSSNNINSKVGPLYPSHGDLADASQELFVLRDTLHTTEANYQATVKVRQLLNTLTTNEEHYARIVSAWKDFRLNNGIVLARIQSKIIPSLQVTSWNLK